MSAKGTSLATALPDRNEPGAGRRLLGMAEDSFATNQTVTLPWFAGEEVTAALWVGEAYDQFTRKGSNGKAKGGSKK